MMMVFAIAYINIIKMCSCAHAASYHARLFENDGKLGSHFHVLLKNVLSSLLFFQPVTNQIDSWH